MWIKTKNKLPPKEKYVLGRHNRGTWIDDDDQNNVNCVVVKLKKGISQEERSKLPDTDERKRLFTSDDEFLNNLVPYSFHTFGTDHFFGQSITHWQSIESI